MSGVGLGGVATILGAYYENEKKKGANREILHLHVSCR